jgi:large subunit ribosomal protein L13e
MVKHNNTTKSGHFKKSWEKRIKTWFNSPLKKIKRRNKRKINKKSFSEVSKGSVFRPIVHCQTKIHNLRVKIGRGFSPNEVNSTGFSERIAKSLGISVDKRKKKKGKDKIFNKKRLGNYFKNLRMDKQDNIIETLFNKRKNEEKTFKKEKSVNFKMEHVYNLTKKKKENLDSYRIIINYNDQINNSRKFILPGFLKYGKWTVDKKLEHSFNWNGFENF